jgi:hypothetical protein
MFSVAFDSRKKIAPPIKIASGLIATSTAGGVDGLMITKSL